MIPEGQGSRLLGGAVACAVGALLAAVIYVHPKGFTSNAPDWVSYSFALVFFFAGVSLCASAFQRNSLQRWVMVGLMGALLIACAWIAVGHGDRVCREYVSVSGHEFEVANTSETTCRASFGVASLLLGVFFGGYLYDAISGGPKA
jgi:hypothetical protein